MVHLKSMILVTHSHVYVIALNSGLLCCCQFTKTSPSTW